MNSNKQNRRNKERGIAMIVALLALLLLAIIGMGFMFMSSTENSANSNYKDSQKAYFASRAGLENVRALLLQGSNLYNQASALTMPVTGPGGPGMIYVFNSNGADTIDPTGGTNLSLATVALNSTLDDELCHEQFALGLSAGTPQAPCGTGTGEVMPGGALAATYYHTPNPALGPNDILGSGTASALPFKWVRITNKQNLMGPVGSSVAPGPANLQVCWDGQREAVVPPGTCASTLSPYNGGQMNPVWLLTALAITPAFGANPGSRRMTQMEVAYTPPLYPPGTISTQAPVNLVGSYSIQSYDNCSCTSTTTGTGPNAVTTYGVSRPGKTCNSQAHVIETGGQVSVNGNSGTIISNYGTNAQTASVQNVNPWPYDTNELINQFEQGAQNASIKAPWQYNCTGTANFKALPPQYAGCGTQTNQTFGTFPPNLVASNGSDASNVMPATVYIPGSVKLSADANGAGVLIVDGDLEINGGLNFYGLLLVRGKVSFTGGGSQAVNLYGAILAGEDVSASDVANADKFGGSVNFKYDRCALTLSAPPGPPKLLATHEVMY